MVQPFYQDTQLAEFLAQAINHNQLQLYVQPQTSISSGKIVGGEVLLRVPARISGFSRHSLQRTFDFSSVSIEEWIQVALHQGLIHPLSEWLVQQVLRHLEHKNRSCPIHVPLSINMPPDMINQSFITFVESCFVKHNSVDTSQIAIEITEFPKPKNLDILNRNIQRLRAMGLKVILDDFGSGYATMNYLVELVVDAVKIDQSFIQKAPLSASARAVLKCLIDLAKEMELEIICEGVETPEQLLLIQQMRCDVVQGFLISAPVPLKQFWLELEKSSKPVLH